MNPLIVMLTRLLKDFLASPEGEQLIMNLIQGLLVHPATPPAK